MLPYKSAMEILNMIEYITKGDMPLSISSPFPITPAQAIYLQHLWQ